MLAQESGEWSQSSALAKQLTCPMKRSLQPGGGPAVGTRSNQRRVRGAVSYQPSAFRKTAGCGKFYHREFQSAQILSASPGWGV